MTAWLWPPAPGTVFLESGINSVLQWLSGDPCYSLQLWEETLPSVCGWGFFYWDDYIRKKASLNKVQPNGGQRQSRLRSLAEGEGPRYWAVVLTLSPTDSCLCWSFLCRLECTFCSGWLCVCILLGTPLELCIYEKHHIFKVLSW